MLTFDEPSHTYAWNGEPVPNVTRIIAHLTDYSHIPAAALEKARQEGRAVHKMAEMHFKGEPMNLPEWMVGHHAALLRFIEETGFWVWCTERQVYHRRLRYAGTLDLAGGFTNLRKSKHLAIIDIKRSFYAGPAIGLQTMAYTDALNNEEGCNLVSERYALRLGADGTYKLKRYDDDPDHADDHPAFLACLQQLRWKERHYG